MRFNATEFGLVMCLVFNVSLRYTSPMEGVDTHASTRVAMATPSIDGA